MTRQRLRLYALPATCALVSGAVGFVLARHLTPPQFAAVAALWAVAGALAWWTWQGRPAQSTVSGCSLRTGWGNTFWGLPGQLTRATGVVGTPILLGFDSFSHVKGECP
jgi:hypothetical protein